MGSDTLRAHGYRNLYATLTRERLAQDDASAWHEHLDESKVGTAGKAKRRKPAAFKLLLRTVLI